MRRKMKTVLCAMLSAVSVFAGAFFFTAVAEIPAPLEGTRYKLMQGLSPGYSNNGDARTWLQSANGAAAGTVVNTLTSVSDYPMLRIDSPDMQSAHVEFNSKAADGSGWDFSDGYGQENFKGFLFYMKAPKTAGAARLTLRLITYNGTADQTLFLQGGAFSYLPMNGDAWVSANGDADGFTAVPSGFEGWIKIPVSTIVSNNPGIAWYPQAYIFYLGLAEVGGAAGPAVVGAPIALSNDTDSTRIILDGGGEIKSLLPAPLEGTRYKLMQGLSPGYSNNGDARTWLQSANGAASGTVVNTLTSVSDYPMLRIDSPDTQSAHVEFNSKTPDGSGWDFSDGYAQDNFKGFLFYVKAPETAGAARLTLRLITYNGAAEQTLFLNGGAFSYLPMNGDAWVSANGDADGFTAVPSGFEGWVKIPVSTIVSNNPGIAWYPQAYIFYLGLAEVGGAAGPAVVGAPMALSNDTDSTRITLDGGGEIKSLLSAAQPPTVVSVSVEWGSMNFEYAGEEWNPDSHTYTGGEWTCATGENKIFVTNNSNIPIAVSFGYEPLAFYGITGVFRSGPAATSAPITSPLVLGFAGGGGTNTSAYLHLSEKPAANLEYFTKIGSVTVSIAE